MLKFKTKKEKLEHLKREIQEGAVRVQIRLTEFGYDTEIWSDSPGPPLEDLVRELIRENWLVINRRQASDAYLMRPRWNS